MEVQVGILQSQPNKLWFLYRSRAARYTSPKIKVLEPISVDCARRQPREYAGTGSVYKRARNVFVAVEDVIWYGKEAEGVLSHALLWRNLKGTR